MNILNDGRNKINNVFFINMHNITNDNTGVVYKVFLFICLLVNACSVYIYYNKFMLVPFLFFVGVCAFSFFSRRNYKTMDVCCVFYLLNLIYFYILDAHVKISTELFFNYSFMSFYSIVLIVVFNNPYFSYKIIKNMKSEKNHLMIGRKLFLCFLLSLFLFVMPLFFNNNVFERYLFFVVGGGMCFYLFLCTILCLVFKRLETVEDRKR